MTKKAFKFTIYAWIKRWKVLLQSVLGFYDVLLSGLVAMMFLLVFSSVAAPSLPSGTPPYTPWSWELAAGTPASPGASPCSLARRSGVRHSPSDQPYGPLDRPRPRAVGDCAEWSGLPFCDSFKWNLCALVITFRYAAKSNVQIDWISLYSLQVFTIHHSNVTYVTVISVKRRVNHVHTNKFVRAFASLCYFLKKKLNTSKLIHIP